MSQYNRNLADKFFNDQCSSTEAEQVLRWLDTPEGKAYLVRKIDTDLVTENDPEILFSGYKKLNPEDHFDKILQRIEQFEKKKRGSKQKDYFSPFLKIAAGFLVVAMASLFVYTSNTFTEGETPDAETVLVTGVDQQKEITLGDGSVIYLNQESSLTLPGSFMEENRQVFLEGEAYFEVAHNSELPFIISTGNAEVEVLGTSFNVKSTPLQGLVEVAVLEGSVSFSSTREQETAQVVLQKGDYAYLDLERIEIETESFGVENYLAWKNRELVFDELPLERICVQLNRFYDITCEFESEVLKDRRLTANVPNNDLENILSVIGSSLYLEYEFDAGHNRVLWQEGEERLAE